MTDQLAKIEAPFGMVNIDALLNKAVDAKSAVEVIERLNAIRREINAEQSKAAYFAAMAAFQAECPVIVKEVGVPDLSGKLAYKYAPVEAIAIQIRPFEVKHGFSHRFPDSDIDKEKCTLTAICEVTHRAGHAERTKRSYPIGTKTKLMSDTQVYAAAETFAQRRALCGAFGLTLAGEDMDGSTGKMKPAGPSRVAADSAAVRELAKELWKLLIPVCGDDRAGGWESRNQWLWRAEVLDAAKAEKAPNLTKERLAEVIAKAREEIR